MLTFMPERTRMIFDCDERMRRAVRIAASEMGKTISEVIADALEQFIPEQLTRAEHVIEQFGDDPPKVKRGRKPKTE